jgi:hypothetical protein
MGDDETILELARTIRLYLPALLGEGPAAAVDRQLAELLDPARQGDDVDDRILDLLREPLAVHNWAAGFVQHGPPEVHERGLSPLPGAGSTLPPPKYVCPRGGDTVWYRRAVGQPVPRCPTHDVTLEPAG